MIKSILYWSVCAILMLGPAIARSDDAGNFVGGARNPDEATLITAINNTGVNGDGKYGPDYKCDAFASDLQTKLIAVRLPGLKWCSTFPLSWTDEDGNTHGHQRVVCQYMDVVYVIEAQAGCNRSDPAKQNPIITSFPPDQLNWDGTSINWSVDQLEIILKRPIDGIQSVNTGPINQPVSGPGFPLY